MGRLLKGSPDPGVRWESHSSTKGRCGKDHLAATEHVLAFQATGSTVTPHFKRREEQ